MRAKPVQERPPRHADARAYLPAKPDAGLPQLRRAAERCRGCDLYKSATQVVFGQGTADARILLIGEQPGDQEDLQGLPFVGPAGKLLDRALADAKVDRSLVYLTNAVKHFKWKPARRGKRRLHAKPGAREIAACLPWLEREVAVVSPGVIVCLGATAGQALFGRNFRVGEARGKVIRDTTWARAVVVTIHPSAVLRIPDHDDRQREYKALVADLRRARKSLPAE